jgi:hypothetical protein
MTTDPGSVVQHGRLDERMLVGSADRVRAVYAGMCGQSILRFGDAPSAPRERYK